MGSLLEKHKLLLIAVLFTLILILVNVFAYNSKSYSILPNIQKDQLYLGTYRENFSDTASIGEITPTHDSLVFKYRLSKHMENAFFAFYLRKENKAKRILKIKDYDFVKLTMKSKYGKRIPFILKFDNYKKIGQKNISEEITFTKLIYPPQKGTIVTYDIPLKDFEIPSWWFRLHDISVQEEPIQEYQDLKHIVLERCEALPPVIQDEMVVYEIEFYNNNKDLIYTSSSLALLFYVFLFAYAYRNKILKSKNIVNEVMVPVAPVEITKDKKDMLDDIKTYIGHNFSNPKISIVELQNELGISQREISHLLKSKMQSSFNSYLNFIRISEVKRLLKESDLPISDIAYKCGYNQIPHFNRVFKKETGKSPKQFRNEN